MDNQNTKRRKWTSTEDMKFVECWAKKVEAMRSCGKNGLIYKEMVGELREQGVILSRQEAKFKIQNLTAKYKKCRGSPSSWYLFNRIHQFIGDLHSTNAADIVKKNKGEFDLLRNRAEVERCAVIYMIGKTHFVFCCEFCSENFKKFLNLVQHLIVHHKFENNSNTTKSTETEDYSSNDVRQEEQEMETKEKNCYEVDKLYEYQLENLSDAEETLIEKQIMPSASSPDTSPVEDDDSSNYDPKEEQEVERVEDSEENIEQGSEKEVEEEKLCAQIEEKNESQMENLSDAEEALIERQVVASASSPDTSPVEDDDSSNYDPEEEQEVERVEDSEENIEEGSEKEVEEEELCSQIEEINESQMENLSDAEEAFIERQVMASASRPDTSPVEQDDSSNCDPTEELEEQSVEDLEENIEKDSEEKFEYKELCSQIKELNGEEISQNYDDEQLEDNSISARHLKGQEKAEKENSMTHETQSNEISDCNFTKLDKGFLCNYCNGRFPTRSRVVQHLSSHATERKYKCSICGKAYKDKYTFKQHNRRQHTDVKRFECPECKFKFHTEGEMKRHLLRHRGEKNFLCTYCGASFFTSGFLTSHIKRHTNTRPNKCDICQKSFFDTSTLKLHKMGQHLNERSFKCPFCDASFKRPDVLRAHKKLHLDEREYRCTLCDAAFNQMPGLYSHMKGKHKILNPSNVKSGVNHSS